mgnify:CR=1 FL=1
MNSEFLSMEIAFIAIAIITTLTTYLFRRRHHRKTGLPPIDERVIQRFYKISLTNIGFFGIMGVLILTILTIMGNDTISVTYIWLYLLLIALSLSFGSFLSRR